jgi:hypothetical protein
MLLFVIKIFLGRFKKGCVIYYHSGGIVKMKKKIFALSCIMLFLLAAIPIYTAQEIEQTTAKESMTFAYVFIEGNTITPLFVGYHFIAGFGRLSLMIAKLDTTGHVEINKLSHPSDSDTIVVDGSRVVILIGFIGHLRWEPSKLHLHGAAVFVSW